MTEPSEVAFLACGAVAQETREVVRRAGWRADVHGIPARLHLEPSRIAPAVDERLNDLTRRYRRVIVVYGDCGTGGRLDDVIARHPAARPAGVHCYEWWSGRAWDRLREDPSAYFLTDWLVRSWDRAVVAGLGLDRFPWLRETYFGHIARVVYLRQEPDADGALARRARDIAAFVGRPLEIVATGLEPLHALLAPLALEAGAVDVGAAAAIERGEAVGVRA
jgi:Protein of unknown function (DUF1638)